MIAREDMTVRRALVDSFDIPDCMTDGHSRCVIDIVVVDSCAADILHGNRVSGADIARFNRLLGPPQNGLAGSLPAELMRVRLSWLRDTKEGREYYGSHQGGRPPHGQQAWHSAFSFL